MQRTLAFEVNGQDEFGADGMILRCRVCDNTEGNRTYEVQEMMFGFKDSFLYFQCSLCGCLQILTTPPNIDRYYPVDYYSFSNILPEQFTNRIYRAVKNLRDAYAVFNKGFLGSLIYLKYPNENLRSLSIVPLTKDDGILDVGCGSGMLLCALKNIGFKNLLGIDPFIKENITYKNGLKIIKGSFTNLDGEWDLIMFHHSFEHVPNPLEALQSVSRILSRKGCCLIRIPIVSSYAWEHYGVNWIQLDAPRHFFLHSVRSIEILAKKANLKLERVIYDSTELQFWGSEQYLRDIPLKSHLSYGSYPSNSIFSKREIEKFKRRAGELNLKNQGDQAAFYLKKI